MQGLVVIDEIMCHRKREPHHDVRTLPLNKPTQVAFLMAHEASGILFGRGTGQREFFQSDKTMSAAFSDIPNLGYMNEITVCVHSQLKLFLFSSFSTASSLSRLSGGRVWRFYDALSRTSATSLSLLSRLREGVCTLALLQPPFRIRWWCNTGDNSLRDALLSHGIDRRPRSGTPFGGNCCGNITRPGRGQRWGRVALQTVD